MKNILLSLIAQIMSFTGLGRTGSVLLLSLLVTVFVVWFLPNVLCISVRLFIDVIYVATIRMGKETAAKLKKRGVQVDELEKCLEELEEMRNKYN